MPVSPPPDVWPDAPQDLSDVGQLFEVLRDTMYLHRVGWPPPLQDDDDGLHVDAAHRVPALMLEPVHSKALRMGLALRSDTRVPFGLGETLLELGYPQHEGKIVVHMARLTLDLIRGTFAALEQPPHPILTLEEAAALMRVAPSTLKRWVGEGRIRKSVKGGKPMRFFRDLFIQEAMSEP